MTAAVPGKEMYPTYQTVFLSDKRGAFVCLYFAEREIFFENVILSRKEDGLPNIIALNKKENKEALI